MSSYRPPVTIIETPDGNAARPDMYSGVIKFSGNGISSSGDSVIFSQEGGEGVSTLTGDSGGTVSPDTSGNINIKGSGGVSVSGSGNTLSLSSNSSIIWSDQGVSTTVEINTGSVSTAPITLILPPSPPNGGICEFILGSNDTLNITANTGHKIRIGNAETAISGSVSTGVVGNSIKLVYNSNLTTWLVPSLIGNWVV